MLKPEHPRDPDFQDAAARPRPRLLPRGRLRRAAAAVGPRRSPSTAGSTCTSPACPRGAAPPRCSTRSGPATRSPAPPRSASSRSSTPGPTFGVMTERIRPTTTPPAPCSPGSPRAARACSWPPSTASPTARSRPASSSPRASASPPRSPSRTPSVDWAEPAVGVDRRIRACTPGPGAWSTHDGERLKLGPVDRHRRQELAPGDAGGPARTPCWSAPAPPPCGSARSRRIGKRADAGRRLGPRRPARPRASGAARPGRARYVTVSRPARAARGRRRDLRRPARDRAVGTSWGDRPTWKVRGKGFLLYRAPHKTAVDADGEPFDDLLVDPGRRRGRQAGAGRGRRDRRSSPSTTSAGYNAVLVSQARGSVRSAATSWPR